VKNFQVDDFESKIGTATASILRENRVVEGDSLQNRIMILFA